MAIDYADEDITVTANQTNLSVSNCTEIDGVHYDKKVVNGTGIAKVHKVVHIKPKYPIVTITAKPSCGFVDYCPHCHHYNCTSVGWLNSFHLIIWNVLLMGIVLGFLIWMWSLRWKIV